MSNKAKAARAAEMKEKMCLHHFLALSVVFENAWLYGLAGGGVEAKTTYSPVKLEPSLAKYVVNQWGKIVKWRYAYVQSLGGTKIFEQGSRGFYRDADEKLHLIEDATVEAWPNGTREDYLIMQTYLLSAAIYDWIILHDVHCAPLRRFEQSLSALADRLILPDSPLVQPMNAAYWKTRDAWQQFPDWTRGGTLEWGESEQDKYERERVA